MKSLKAKLETKVHVSFKEIITFCLFCLENTFPFFMVLESRLLIAVRVRNPFPHLFSQIFIEHKLQPDNVLTWDIVGRTLNNHK